MPSVAYFIVAGETIRRCACSQIAQVFSYTRSIPSECTAKLNGCVGPRADVPNLQESWDDRGQHVKAI